MKANHGARLGSKYHCSGKFVDLLHNNCMLSVLIGIASKGHF